MTFAEALQVLDLDRSAGPDRARRAYLKGLKTHSPERDPEGFRRLREAYDTLSAQPWQWGATENGEGEVLQLGLAEEEPAEEPAEEEPPFGSYAADAHLVDPLFAADEALGTKQYGQAASELDKVAGAPITELTDGQLCHGTRLIMTLAARDPGLRVPRLQAWAAKLDGSGAGLKAARLQPVMHAQLLEIASLRDTLEPQVLGTLAKLCLDPRDREYTLYELDSGNLAHRRKLQKLIAKRTTAVAAVWPDVTAWRATDDDRPTFLRVLPIVFVFVAAVVRFGVLDAFTDRHSAELPASMRSYHLQMLANGVGALCAPGASDVCTAANQVSGYAQMGKCRNAEEAILQFQLLVARSAYVVPQSSIDDVVESARALCGE